LYKETVGLQLTGAPKPHKGDREQESYENKRKETYRHKQEEKTGGIDLEGRDIIPIA